MITKQKALDKALNLAIGNYFFKIGLMDELWLNEFKKIVDEDFPEDE